MKSRFHSLRQASLAVRVTLIVGITFLVCIFALGLIIQDSINRHFAEQDADELGVVAAAVQRALQGGVDDVLGDAFQKRLAKAVSGHHGMYYSVFDPAGNNLYSSPGPNLSSLLLAITPVEKISPDNLYQWSEGDMTYRGVILELDAGSIDSPTTYTVVVASLMNFHLRFMSVFRTRLWAVLGCLSLIILFSAWLAAVIAHRPLHRMSQQIGSITTEKLNVRLDPDSVPVDLLELVYSFNEMISRIEEVFQRLSNFSADIAHELRTPITNLTTQTQVSLSKVREPEEYREILYSNLEEYERIARMIHDMLWLARSDNGMLKPTFSALELAGEITELFDYLGPWAEDGNVALALEGSCPMIKGDRDMLRRALTNLLTNAIDHADPGTSIRVRLGTDNRSARIRIENQGNAIPTEHLPKIFDRFYRADPSRQRAKSGGRAGLGLAIVKSIVELHGGEITVTSENRRTVFEIFLPLVTFA